MTEVIPPFSFARALNHTHKYGRMNLLVSRNSERTRTFMKRLSALLVAVLCFVLASCSNSLAEQNDIVSLYQKNEDTFLQAEKLPRDPRVLGIKIHPTFHQYELMEYGDRIFQFADAHKAVVLMHPVMTPEGMAQTAHFAEKYPDVKLIVAHLCSLEHIELLKNHENIYTDTSGGASNLNNVLEYAVEQAGSEKILFGTDGYSAEFQFGRVALSRIAQADKENILFKNAQKLFPNAF